MKRWILVLGLAVGMAACDTNRPTDQDSERPIAGIQAAVLDPALSDALVIATDTDELEVIVNFDETLTTADAMTTAIQQLGAGLIQFRHLSMLAALATPPQIGTIATMAGVQSVYLNSELQYHLAEGVRSVRADEVHAQGVTGAGIGVAILDTGVDGLYHPDLAFPDKTVQNVKFIADTRDLFESSGPPAVGASLWVENLANSETTVGHGTHVGGIAAGTGEASGGKYTGVAPGADVVGLGTGDILFIFWAIAGFDYILEHRTDYNIKVVNNSWGSQGDFDPDDPIAEATRTLHDAGVTVVFSSGNSGPDQDTMNRHSLAPWVISVAAGCKVFVENDPTISAVHCDDPTGQGRDGVLADFSSRGVPGDDMNRPDITAPGVHVVSARASTGTVLNALDALHDFDLTSTCAISDEHVTFYTCASGTSMSAPHITGVVALMQEVAGGNLTPDQVLEIMAKTARPLEGFAPWEVGAGFVDAAAAVNEASKGKYRNQK